jgi:hypothetical protein
MRQSTVSRYYMPLRPGKKVRQPSTWLMSPEDAAARGLTEADIVPGSTVPREVPETEAEMQASQFNARSAGMGGVRGPKT